MQEVRPSATACTDVHPLSGLPPPLFSLLFVPVTCPSTGALLLIDEYQPTSPALGLREMRRSHTKSSCCRSTRQGAVGSISLRNPCLLHVAALPLHAHPLNASGPARHQPSSWKASYKRAQRQRRARARLAGKRASQAVSQAVAITSP